ncbi:hypothetical protein TIFTF001_006687 [Ficus carica]|uniref:Acyl-[acyl-carrier-protein] hydrolase n=1 Tax=Ficus carica TaxID=3494 RepID=A0AA87ZNL1_FICCA|nr:hypothetical protein TIFTF001_006687 [Ficus carica]
MELHLAAPRSFKQEIVSIRRRIGGNKLKLDRGSRLKCKADFSAEDLMNKNKAINKRFEHFGWKSDWKLDDNYIGRLMKGGLLFQQNFLVRSYELGPDCKMSIGALVNLLQESSLNHLKSTGVMVEGFGSTPEMIRRSLIWVVCRLHIVVDAYPSWGDVVQVETWACASGRNGVRRDWLIRDYNTCKTLLRASSGYVMMNKETRKLSKFIEKTREEVKVILMDYCDPIIEEDDTELRDLDFQAANYVGTSLSSAPDSIVETHKLRAIRVEFRKECEKKSLLQSLGALASETDDGVLELDHTLCLVENGSQILRARTVWMPRN